MAAELGQFAPASRAGQLDAVQMPVDVDVAIVYPDRVVEVTDRC
jgi:hypothetical protein